MYIGAGQVGSSFLLSWVVFSFFLVGMDAYGELIPGLFFIRNVELVENKSWLW